MAALLVAAAVAGCQRSKATAAAGSRDPGIRVAILRVEPSTQQRTRRYAGYAHPWDAAGVGFLVPGRVSSVRVEPGDHVKKGQLLATLDPDDYALVTRLADVQAKTLKPNVERVDSLVQKQILPQSQLDELRGRFDAAMLQQQQAKRQLAYTELYAPIDGLVHEKQTSVGQVIGAGMPAVIVLDVHRLKIKFGVTQSDLPTFREGETVTVTFDGMAGNRTGTVHHIEAVADTVTRTFAVVVAVDNPDEQLKPSMLAHIERVSDRVTGIFVPLHTVRRDEAGQTRVMLLAKDASTTQACPVVLGPLFGDQVQIREGLKGGEALIVRGQEFVQPGERVQVQGP